ncbi:MAG TPA: sensor histidine kinase [Actinomycetes bacterium]
MNESVSARPVRDRLWSALGGSGDLARAAAIGVVQVGATFFAAHNQPERKHLGLLAVALLVAGPAALVVRRRWPLQVLAFVLAVTLAYYVLGYPYGPVFLALIVALFTAVTRGHRRAAWLLAGAGVAAWFVLQTLVGWGQPPEALHFGLVAGWLLVVLTVSEIARAGRQRAVEAEEARRQEGRRRADEERLRIARELHDVVAHNISLINVQAGVALHLIDERPEQARTALAAIKQASNEALGELRSVLDVLRQVDEASPRAPTAGLAGIDDLVARTAAAGLEVRTRVEGEPRPLPAGVDLAAFRIVQEALTNVARHAGPASATVRIAYGDDDLTVQVDDDGRGTGGGTSGGGNGIPGMRERAAALGGRLRAGPRPGGGFQVLASLPIAADGHRRGAPDGTDPEVAR